MVAVNDLSDKMNFLSLDQQNNFKTLLISSLSHELSNPLHFLVNTLQNMKRMLDRHYNASHQEVRKLTSDTYHFSREKEAKKAKEASQVNDPSIGDEEVKNSERVVEHVPKLQGCNTLTEIQEKAILIAASKTLEFQSPRNLDTNIKDNQEYSSFIHHRLASLKDIALSPEDTEKLFFDHQKDKKSERQDFNYFTSLKKIEKKRFRKGSGKRGKRRKESSDNLITEFGKMVPLMVANINKYSLLVNSFLDYSLIMTKRFIIHPNKFSVIDLLSKSLELFHEDANVKGISLGLLMYGDVPKMWRTDECRLQEVVYHLLSNSLKFTYSGEVEVLVSYDKFYNLLRISVKDSGVGMTTSQLERLNNLLKNRTAAEKVSEDSSGEGIGLLITHSILSQIQPPGCQLMIESSFMKGSMFTFFISYLSSHQENSYNNYPFIERIDSNNSRSHSVFLDASVAQSGDGFGYSSHDCNINSDIILKQTGGLKLPPTDIIKRKMASQNFHRSCSMIILNQIDEELDDIYEKPGSGQVLNQEGMEPEKVYEINRNKKVKNSSFLAPVMKNCKCKKILIVDDDHQNIKATSYVLDSFKLQVFSAINGLEGLNMVKTLLNSKCSENCKILRFIIMDCNMPIMNGIDATKEIRKVLEEDAGHPEVPIIGLTAYSEPETLLRFQQAGTDYILKKPAKFKDLNRLVQEILRKQNQDGGVLKY